MKIVIIQLYRDLTLQRLVHAGEILTVSSARGQVLVDKGFAVVIPTTEPKPAKISKKESVPKAQPPKKAQDEMAPQNE